MSGHTPGPWTTDENVEGGPDAPFGIWANGQVIATTVLGRPSDLANARLMAAAPEMLEALEIADELASLNATNIHRADELSRVFDIKRRAATAKALGEQPS